MLQRNISGYTVTVPLLPAEIGPGETIEYPELLAGFEQVEPEPAPKAGSSLSQPSKKQAEQPAPAEEGVTGDAAL